MEKHSEIERKFDAPAGTGVLPDLAGVRGVASVTEPTETHMAATYFDTPSLALAARRITLRRRTGGADAGWHLKRPAVGDERTELRLPLGSSGSMVPPAMLDEIRVHVRDHPVLPVAVVRTQRFERHLIDADGRDVAVVTGDLVQAQRFGDGAVDLTAWQEVEVELVDGDEQVLEATAEVLERAGLHRSRWTSKLQHALQADPPPLPARAGRRSTVAEILVAHLRDQVEAILVQDPLVRTDEPDAVHQMRVATRRIRSALTTFRKVLDRSQIDPIRSELKWLAGLLGGPRDAEVLRARLDALVDAQPAELIMGPVRARMSSDLGQRHRDARSALLEALDEERYFRLLDVLDGLLADPPLTDAARKRADRAIPKLVGHAACSVDRAAKVAAGIDAGAAYDSALHEVRKAAKQARYAAESARPAVGRPAKRFALRMETLQEALGEHQDAVTARQVLRELGVSAHLANENGFTFGLLHGLEHGRAEDAMRSAAPLLRAPAEAEVRGWRKP